MFCILTWSSMLLIQVNSVPALQAIKAWTVSGVNKRTTRQYEQLYLCPSHLFTKPKRIATKTKVLCVIYHLVKDKRFQVFSNNFQMVNLCFLFSLIYFTYFQSWIWLLSALYMLIVRKWYLLLAKNDEKKNERKKISIRPLNLRKCCCLWVNSPPLCQLEGE